MAALSTAAARRVRSARRALDLPRSLDMTSFRPRPSVHRHLGLAVALAAALAALPQFATPALATTTGCDRYASPHGSDSASGIRGHPFRTARRLADSLRAGQKGCLAYGVYRGKVTITHGGSGSRGRV